jgi:hypothetical protein
MHASFVIVFLVIFVVFILGAYETLAAVVNPDASVLLPLIQSRSRAPQAAVDTDRPWLTIGVPTQVYSVRMDPLRTAQPGEQYRVMSRENGWVLGIRQGDSPDSPVWIAPVQTQGPTPVQLATIIVALVATTLLGIIISFGVRRRLLTRRSRRPRPRREVAIVPPASDATNGSGRLSSAS